MKEPRSCEPRSCESLCGRALTSPVTSAPRHGALHALQKGHGSQNPPLHPCPAAVALRRARLRHAAALPARQRRRLGCRRAFGARPGSRRGPAPAAGTVSAAASHPAARARTGHIRLPRGTVWGLLRVGHQARVQDQGAGRARAHRARWMRVHAQPRAGWWGSEAGGEAGGGSGGSSCVVRGPSCGRQRSPRPWHGCMLKHRLTGLAACLAALAASSNGLCQSSAMSSSSGALFFLLSQKAARFFLFARVPPHARVTLRLSQFAKEPHLCCPCRHGIGCCFRLRPPRPQDFSAIIPGHGGVFDRIDCQLIMGLFTYTYYSTFVQNAGAQACLGVSLVLQCRRDRTMRHV